MIDWIKRHEATYTDESPREYPNGKVTLDNVTYHIMDWHSFDDFSQTIETVQVWNPITKRLFEIYSMDEGDTFCFTM